MVADVLQFVVCYVTFSLGLSEYFASRGLPFVSVHMQHCSVIRGTLILGPAGLACEIEKNQLKEAMAHLKGVYSATA